MMHVGDAWKAWEKATTDLAARFPAGTFTCIRDVIGRCSVAVEGYSEDVARAVDDQLALLGEASAYGAATRVRDLATDSVAELVRSARRPLGEAPNAFLVERLLSNESWLGTTSKPADWPAVVSFYSFKGGVGRSTAAGVVALLLARQGRRVALLDLDLEAPGLEQMFFDPPAERTEAGLLDYLIEGTLGEGSFNPDLRDYVAPFSDPAISAKGGALFVVPAGALDDAYVEKLGRVNASDPATVELMKEFINRLVKWQQFDVVVVDCRTGFTDIGGLTLNGLADLDVLAFRATAQDLRALPVVLSRMQRVRQGPTTLEHAHRLARSFLVTLTMADGAPNTTEGEQHAAKLRSTVREACWSSVFSRFEAVYSYPADNALDTPFEPVPHDAVLLPYIAEFPRLRSVIELLEHQARRPETPYEELARRISEVKLALRVREVGAKASDAELRRKVLKSIREVVQAPSGEKDFRTAQDLQARFLPRSAHRILLDPQAFLVLGRKGAGKSALFQLLRNPDYLKAVSEHLGVPSEAVTSTKWGIGFERAGGFPDSDDLVGALNDAADDPDLLVRYWRALASLRVAATLQRKAPGVRSHADARTLLRDEKAQQAIRAWLTDTNSELEAAGAYCSLSFDDLDVGMPRDPRRRSMLLSALVAFWQQADRTFPRIRAKVFLREDIWSREIDFADKAKLREGIDRTTITWDALDIYRAVLKRLGHSDHVRALFQQSGLWSSDFDEQRQSPLGFIPPEDEIWVRSAVELLAGETMASGVYGYKKGYVYTWVVNHIADAGGALRPRSALLLFSSAANGQRDPAAAGPILKPQSFVDALRDEVSRAAVDDLREEYAQEWRAKGKWVPDTFADLERIWPVPEQELEKYLDRALGLGTNTRAVLEQMVQAGLLEPRERKGIAYYQIPDIFLFGLGLTRRG
jgi:cellulose biosynthesis protein BcsQ